MLLVLRKQVLGEIWPRLLSSEHKPPFISIEFDPWQDDLEEGEDEHTDEKEGLFGYYLFLP